MPSVPNSRKRWICKHCGVIRSKEKDGLCPVCWLVDELAREHRDGEHVDRINESCVDCTRKPKKEKSKQISIDHSKCGHPITSRARVNCRRQRRMSDQ